MRGIRALVAGVLAVLVLTSSTPSGARGAGIVLVGDPSFSDLGTSLQAVVVVGGVEGMVTLTRTLTAEANAATICTNPGGNVAPGQRQVVPVTVTSGEATFSAESQDGQVTFLVTTQPPANLTWEQAGCPNSSWTATITDLDFKSATITLSADEVTDQYWFCLWRWCF